VKNLTLLLLISFFLACDYEPIQIIENPINEFEGLWSGSFEGDDNGTWTFSIEDSGQVSGSLTSKDDNLIYALSGSVNSFGRLELLINLNSNVGSFVGNLNNGFLSGTFQNSDDNKEGVFSGRKSTDDEAQILNTWHFYSQINTSGETILYDNEIFCEDLFMQFNEDGTFVDDFDINECEEPQYYGTFSVQDGYYELLYVQGGTQDMSENDIYIEYPDENTIVYEYNGSIWTYKLDISQ